MSREFRFFIYLLERYAVRNGETADKTLDRIKGCGLFNYAVGMYELYHVEDLKNAFADLDRHIADARRGLFHAKVKPLGS